MGARPLAHHRVNAIDGRCRPRLGPRIARAASGRGDLRRRSPLVGVLALFAVAAAETVVIPELGHSSEAGAAALYERIFEFGSTRWTVLLVAVLLLPVGLVAISYGLYRAQVAPTWAAGALGLGALLFAAALPTGSAVLFAIGLAAMVVGMAPIGWKVLGETDEQWEHPPRLRARPAT